MTSYFSDSSNSSHCGAIDFSTEGCGVILFLAWLIVVCIVGSFIERFFSSNKIKSDRMWLMSRNRVVLIASKGYNPKADTKRRASYVIAPFDIPRTSEGQRLIEEKNRDGDHSFDNL